MLLIYVAFKVSYRTAAAYEQVTMTPSTLTVRKVSHRGKVAEWTLNPVWVRLQREANEELGIERLFLVSHGRRLPVATFLGPREKANFANALSAALGEARRGPSDTGMRVRASRRVSRPTPRSRVGSACCGRSMSQGAGQTA